MKISKAVKCVSYEKTMVFYFWGSGVPGLSSPTPWSGVDFFENCLATPDLFGGITCSDDGMGVTRRLWGLFEGSCLTVLQMRTA